MTQAEYSAAVREELGHKPPWCRADARRNFDVFEEHREDMVKWVRHFHADPWLAIGDKCHNASGTRSGMAWLMAAALEPDRTSPGPCLDFNEESQTVFLRRGLLVYLRLLEAEVCAPQTDPTPEGQGEFVWSARA